MGRIKNIENFGKRNYESESLTPKKIFILSVEGNKTEYDYFTYISDDQNVLGINSLIKIELLERIDTNSSPSWVLNLLEEYRDVYGVKPEDRLWMIIDRDIHNNSESAINQVISNCEKNGFNIAITNPCFELWLLLHCVKSLETYDINTLLENPKKRVKSRKRYIEELLMEINGSYNKKNLNKEHYITYSKIKNAIVLEKEIENEPTKILTKLGSNIGSLVTEIFENHV